MQQTGLVILTPIKSHKIGALCDLLRADIDPVWDAKHARLICRDSMPFDQLFMLHFGCMAILDEDAGDDRIAPCLMFEATFDGTVEDFLDDLLEHCGPGLDLIYAHCEGYPTSGSALPHLVKTYLLAHNVQPQIYFQGHPGRSLAEIHGENSLRLALIGALKHIAGPRSQTTPPRSVVLRHLRRFVLSDPAVRTPRGPDFRWAAEARAEPTLTTWGRTIVIGAAFCLAALIGLVTVHLLQPDSLAHMAILQNHATPIAQFDGLFAEGLWASLITALLSWPFWFGDMLRPPPSLSESALWTTGTLALSWAVVRGIQYLCARQSEPPDAGTRWMLVVALFCASLLIQISAIVTIFGVFLANLPVLEPFFWRNSPVAAGALTCVLTAVALTITALFLRYASTMATLDRSFGHGSKSQRALLSFMCDALRLCLAFFIWLFIAGLHWITGLLDIPPADVVLTAISWTILGTTGVLAFLLVLIALAVVWLLTIRTREKRDDEKHYENATALAQTHLQTHRFAREGHGVNKVQNHLISLSRIKPGRLRLWRLRLVTFVVNQMCYWWFTRGRLGDVADIHFLRWIIIDRGRRLLFLDTYQGSWSGYLDAFIDSGSVYALNAIWSHTFQWVNGVDRRVSFPWTKCLFWNGARNEQPFKTAVRASQKESIVWYSAYPLIGGARIVKNSNMRNALFQPLDTAEADRLITGIR